MGKRLDKIIVVDVESTCWQSSPPAGQESEIIEIGVCLLDRESGQRQEKRSILVQPQRSTVSHFCTQLTTLTPADVAGGLPFSQAVAILRDEYGAGERVWASYGDYDRRQFLKQCQSCHIPYPFGPTHINVKNLFALLKALPTERSLAEALEYMGWEMEGTYHRGADDAWNIARLLADLIGCGHHSRKDKKN